MINQFLNLLKKRLPPQSMGRGSFAQATTNQSAIMRLRKRSRFIIKG